MIRKERLFDARHENTCQLYRDIRDGKNEGCLRAQMNCNNLWFDFREFSDNNFVSDFPINFHQRWFEMYLTVFFIRSGLKVTCPKPGPDILLEIDGRRIWIEAVCPTPGEPDYPDSVPEPPDIQSQSEPLRSRPVPFKQYAMRVCNSLGSKQAKFKNYLRKEIVGQNDFMVIAINVAGIPLLCYNMEETMIRSLYGVGNKYFSVDPMTGRSVGSGRMYNREIEKKTGGRIGVEPFIDGGMKHVSAVIGSSEGANFQSEDIGKDCVLYRNLTAKNRWPKNCLTILNEYQIESTEGGYIFQEP